MSDWNDGSPVLRAFETADIEIQSNLDGTYTIIADRFDKGRRVIVQVLQADVRCIGEERMGAYGLDYLPNAMTWLNKENDE